MFKSKLKLRTTLPDLGKYTIGEDFASIMIEEILQRRPRLIVEAESGVSTILAAYCLQKIGGDALKSFEHLENYIEDTQNMLVQHELKSVDVKMLNAPLREYIINQEIFYWYSMNHFHISEKTDMLIVDGSPRAT